MTDTKDRELSLLRKELRILQRRLEQCQRNRSELGFLKDKLDHVIAREECARVDLEHTSAELRALTESLDADRRQSNELIESLLPSPILAELRMHGRVAPRITKSATVLFAGLVDFDSLAACLDPSDLIEILDALFSSFDVVTSQYGLEPLKTIGDHYRSVGGLFPSVRAGKSHAVDAVAAAIEMISSADEILARRLPNPLRRGLRVGIDTGSVVSGMVGQSKLNFDVWGEPVTRASWLMKVGDAEQVNISRNMADACRNAFRLHSCGWMGVEHRGGMEIISVEYEAASGVHRVEREKVMG